MKLRNPAVRSALGALLLGLFALAVPGHGQTISYAVSMDGGQSGTGSTGTGFATLNLNTGTGEVTLSGTYSGLGTSQTVAHIHGPAAIGGNAGIVLALSETGGTAGSLSGSGTLSAANVTNLLNARLYVNVHSTGFPGGEIRGHIVQRFNVDCPAALVTDPALTDTGGDPTFGPRIGHTTQRFNVSLDCSGAGGPSLYLIELRLNKLVAPSGSPWGDVWVSGPKLVSCSGPHGLGVVSCFPGAGVVLPNDLALVGRTYTAQGFCGDSTAKGRMSNAITQVIGI